ncbi:MAG: hypothetical protein RMM98_03190 [Acidobacteriota bacterium]|nr:hypothetical protein [Blastocatellia bacterium]MDW8238598.1 hypothetical protein [Acidobacteriota bacterium]
MLELPTSGVGRTNIGSITAWLNERYSSKKLNPPSAPTRLMMWFHSFLHNRFCPSMYLWYDAADRWYP